MLREPHFATTPLSPEKKENWTLLLLLIKHLEMEKRNKFDDESCKLRKEC